MTGSTMTLPADAKRTATATARAALRGITVHRLQDDRGRPEFVVSWHALPRAFSSIDDVEGWLDRFEGVTT